MLRFLIGLFVTMFLWANGAQAAFVLLDPGILTKQIAVDAGNVYALKYSGNIWRFNRNIPGWTQIDPGTGTKQIASNGVLYALKDSGNIWELGFGGQWRLIDQGTGTRMMAVGDFLWILKDNGEIWAFYQGQWSHVPAMRQDNYGIFAAGAALWAVKWDGGVERLQLGSPFPVRISTVGATRDLVGNANEVYAVNSSGEIWYYNSFQQVRLSSDHDNESLAYDAERGFLYTKKTYGAVLRYDSTFGSWALIDNAANTVDLVASRNQLFELKDNGNIWSWHPEF